MNVLIFPPAWRSWRAWHWGSAAVWRMGGDPRVVEPLENVTVRQQQELYDATWLILTQRRVSADVSTYRLAMEIANALTGLRDRQREP